MPFAKVAVYAVFNGQRTAVLSVGTFSTSGNGLLPKITRDPSWVAPDLMFWVNDPDMPDEPSQFPIDILLLKPRSRGSVTLRSADPADPPRILFGPVR